MNLPRRQSSVYELVNPRSCREYENDGIYGQSRQPECEASIRRGQRNGPRNRYQRCFPAITLFSGARPGAVHVEQASQRAHDPNSETGQ